MATKQTLAERLRSMALELRAQLLYMDEYQAANGLVFAPDRTSPISFK
jgi:hypothetical protein